MLLVVGSNENLLYIRRSSYRPQIPIQPVESFFDQLIVRRDMPRVKDGVALVLLRRSEKKEHRILRGFQWTEVIVLAINHEGGHGPPWREVDFIDFGQLLPKIKAPADQHKSFNAPFNDGKNVPE